MAAVEKVNSSVTNRIENELLEADGDVYIANVVRNWPLLRKHVFALQGYCKTNLGGKIPPKHQLKKCLALALNESEPSKMSQSKQRKHRDNPTKEVLESKGVVFPVFPESLSSDPVCDKSDVLRYNATCLKQKKKKKKSN
jgi:hypothetical protein